MKGLRPLLGGSLLLVLLALAAPVRAEEQKKPPPRPEPVSEEDRKIAENLELLELFEMLRDLDMITERKKGR